MAWLFSVGSRYKILIHATAEKNLYIREHLQKNLRTEDMQDGETVMWKTSVKQLGFVTLHLEIWTVFSPRNAICPDWPRGPPWPAVCWQQQQLPAPRMRKTTLWFPFHKESSVMCESLPDAYLGLSLLHGLKTLRVAGKATQLPDQNQRQRPKCYAFPTEYIATLPALGGRQTRSSNISWLTWQKQTLNFWVLSSACCSSICWKMPPGDREKKNSRAITTTSQKPLVPPASGDLQQLLSFTWDCKYEGKRKREEEVGTSVCKTVSWGWIVAAQTSKTH